MPLTPEEVVNKRFSQTQFRAGYDQDEVDDFLDEVVVELRRLISENEELRAGIVPSAAPASNEAAVSTDSAVSEPAVSEETAVVEVVEETPEPEPTPEPVAAAPVAAAVPAEAAYGEDAASTTSLLQLARKLHDEHVKEGADKRAELIAEGQATADRLVAEAEQKQRTELAKLNQEKAGIEHRIDELRTFEKEYRQTLRKYIEDQLHGLDSSGSESSEGAAQSSVSI
ncbi:DivIVA domain-containing protein [Subtercola endophyticus]|uniref:DivIVA domain-containing protein n=1 Tax=Subtercola endophyticus TaxID=2895559 RepID=UPI002729E54C|nr:DivIVA domain-containing protein [Subtercola endophyticus]